MKFVYETQKTDFTIIFTGGNHPSINIIQSFINKLNTKNIYFIAADSGLDLLSKCGYSCNLVIGDMDSIKNKNLLEKTENKEVIYFPKDKDYSDTELALIYAKKYCPKAEIVLIGGSGGRFDHYFSLIDIYFKKQFPLPTYWLTEENQIVTIGKINYYRKLEITNTKMSDNISVFCIDKNVMFNKVCSNNLKWKLSKVNWNKTSSLSNRPNSENCPIEISAKKGNYIIVLPFSAEVVFK